MKFNKWTMGLAAVGVVSLASAARADEKMNVVNTALSNTTLSGYIDTSAQYNFGSQNGGMTPGYAFGAGKADGFNLNAVDIALDKPMDESPWAAGYHVELMFGPDATPGQAGTTSASAITSTDLDSHHHHHSTYYTLDTTSGSFLTSVSYPNYIRQAYIALRTPIGNSGIDWKVGVWDSILGYESNSDPLNPNYTRSYGYTMEPTTFTGILGTYKINDSVALQAGVADGEQVGAMGYVFGPTPVNGRNVQETKKAYMGAIALTAPDGWGWMKGATLNAGIINNDDGAHSRNSNPANWGTTSIYAGVTVPTPVTALKVGAAFDYLSVHDAHATVGSSWWNSTSVGNTDSSAWNVALYTSYQANDKLSFNLRGEHIEFNTSMKAHPWSHGYSLPAADEITFTTQYAIWANVLSRVEFRWDHVEHGTAFDNSAYSQTGTNIHDNAFMLALNLIYQF